ncbi:MAG: hypothetical protein P8Y43_04690 [Sulfurovaceae bacterium]
MKIHGSLKINGKYYAKGSEVSWFSIYPFFLFHMLAFGLSGFYMAYFAKNVELKFLFLHGGFAIIAYILFYVRIFGFDDVKWALINAFLGFVGIYTQMGWILDYFGKDIDNYPFYIHIIPFFYFVLYTFLLRQAVLDITGSREKEREQKVELGYVAVLLGGYLLSYLLR